MSDSAELPAIYAALDAAARPLLDHHEPAPLLRLYASRLAIDESYFGLPVSAPGGHLCPVHHHPVAGRGQNTENYTACLDWLAPTTAQVPITPTRRR